MAILLAALITVFYVSNVISIDSLLEENQQLKKKYTMLKNKNELLRTRINELQSADRIIKIATEELGMLKPEKIPEKLP
jgi:cell division protein FtsL